LRCFPCSERFLWGTSVRLGTIWAHIGHTSKRATRHSKRPRAVRHRSPLLLGVALDRNGLLTPEPPPLRSPRIRESEEHVFGRLLVAGHRLEVKLKCRLARRKHRYEVRRMPMNDGRRGRKNKPSSCCALTSATLVTHGIAVLVSTCDPSGMRTLKMGS